LEIGNLKLTACSLQLGEEEMNILKEKKRLFKKRRKANRDKKAPPKTRRRRTKKIKTGSVDLFSSMKKNLLRAYALCETLDKHSAPPTREMLDQVYSSPTS